MTVGKLEIIRSMGSQITSQQPNHLRRWRALNGLTLEELAGLVGLSPAMVSRAERGERQLKPLTRVRVARLLGVPVGELFPVDAMEQEEATA
jgi:transcriptional regulator with XRE-family HTH domain